MADYNLHGLNTRDFQHLVQAIGRKVISPNVVAFGDGKDGNRDLACKGHTKYPSSSEQWDGYLVVGVKFRQRPEKATDLAWAIAQLEADLKKYLASSKKYKRPDYFIFATNVSLTAVPEVGGRDKLTKVLEGHAQRLGIKGTSVWDYNDIRGFLDGAADIRIAYGHLITAGDVLHELLAQITAGAEELNDVMHTFLQKEFVADISAKLQSAGDDPELQIPLANVFVDLPFAVSAADGLLSSEDSTEGLIVARLLQAGAGVHRNSTVETDADDQHAEESQRRQSSYVVVGGPGQGKSTVGQHLCQLYRAAILAERPAHLLDIKAKIGIGTLRAEWRESFPIARRWPLRIELRNFAHALAQNPQLSLFEFMRLDLARLGNGDVGRPHLKKWLAEVPTLIVLDGLDEVPPSSNRQEVMREIESLRVDLLTRDADVLLLTTTRPQSYSSEFSAGEFTHWYLRPLAAKQALHYGTKLAEARCGADDRRRDELVKSLKKASANPATSRLMQSPLQVTIMATLVEETGEPPQQRYRLFAEYYRTIYRRETRRKLLGGVLSERQKDIDVIHAIAGLLLHAASEVSSTAEHIEHDDPGEVDSALSDQQFRSLVRRRLEQIKVPEPRIVELLSKISDESLQRLVFLVRPREGWIRFDIASLKEFMAAEALMTGSDEDVRERLRATAAASYWRNVFLFACGKCFVEKEHLLDSLVSLCAGLDEEASSLPLLDDVLASQCARALLWGSRLALDIVADGTAKQYPGYEVTFVRRALQLLRFPDFKISGALAAALSSDLEAVYKSEVAEALRSKTGKRAGALLLLLAIGNRGIEWAKVAFREECSDSELAWIVRTMVRGSVPSFLTEVLASRFGVVDPRFFRHSFVNLKLPEPLRSAVRLLDLSGKMKVANSSEWAWLVGTFEVHRLDRRNAAWKKVARVEFTNKSWIPFTSAARFAANPSAETLADELRLIADAGVPIPYLQIWEYPWPLGECIQRSASLEQLREWADAASKGAMGDRAIWKTAEGRWEREGVTEDDHRHNFGDLPFSTTIGKVGFPFASSVQRGGRTAAKVRFSLEEFRSLGKSARVKYAKVILYEYGYPRQRRTAEWVDYPELERDVPVPDSPWLDSFLEAMRGRRLNDFDFQTLNWVGQHSQCWTLSSDSWPNEAAQIQVRFCADPAALKGLLPVLAELASTGAPCSIPAHLFEEILSWSGSRWHVLAAALRAISPDVTESEVQSIGSLLAAQPSSNRSCRTALNIVAKHDVALAAKLALAVMEKVEICDEPDLDLSAFANRLIERFLETRPSRLQSAENWQRLRLPERL